MTSGSLGSFVSRGFVSSSVFRLRGFGGLQCLRRPLLDARNREEDTKPPSHVGVGQSSVCDSSHGWGVAFITRFP